MLYVSVNPADNVFKNSQGQSVFKEGKPYISITNPNNANVWYKKAKNNLHAEIDQTEYHPENDTWPGNGNTGVLTPVQGKTNLWYLALSEKPAAGTDFTIWTKSAPNFYNVDRDMSFGVFPYDGTNNTIVITNKTALTVGDVQDNYALTGNMNTSGSGVGFDGNGTGDEGIGEWSEVTKPTGSTATFIHTSNVDSVKVIFNYGGDEFKMDMIKDETDPTGRTWNTIDIPDTIKSGISFEDSNGNVWKDTGSERSNAKHYYYAKTANGTSSTGTGWSRVLSPEGDRTFYFKHYDSSTTNVKAVTVSYLYEGVPFSFSLTRGSDNKTWSTANIPDDATSVKYSDGTRTWSITDFSSSNTYCYALDNNQYLLRNSANYARIYLERNYTWNDIKIHYTGTGASALPGNAMVDLGRKYNGSPLYCYLVPTDAGYIVFTGIQDGNLQQTINLTSYHTTDMRKFKFGSLDSSQNKYKCTNTTISASSLK